MCFVEGETDSYSETCVTCDGGTEEVSIEFEEAIDIKEESIIKVEEPIDTKDEILEAISFPPIKTHHEVRLRCVCEVVATYAFRPFIAPKKGICESALRFFLLCVIQGVPRVKVTTSGECSLC
jgi:hypothetical protein